MNNTAIKVENMSKLYRIGLKENLHDTFSKSVFNFIKSPLKNFRKYRSLYKFDDLKPGQGDDHNPSDIIWALRDVSFEIRSGEVVGIIGSNGAGKSTLLKILSRITVPTSGQAEIHGKISSLLEVGTGFHPELTGRENVYLNGTILGMRKNDIDQKFDEIVDFSGVEKFIDTPVKRYSSGMKVRLAFAVAAHLEPEILIVDEVLAVGDAEFQKKCLNRMENVGREGRTVLFVSHNMPAIMNLCDRVILFNDGTVIDDGTSYHVVRNYLSANSNTTAEREWLDKDKAPGGEVSRLLAVRVMTEDDVITDKLDIRKPVKIEMEYEVIKSGYLLLPHYILYNEEGILIFKTLDLNTTWRQHPRPEGRYVSSVLIPGNLLAEGTIYVSPVLITLNPNKPQFFERDVISFQVFDDFHGNSARGDWTGNFGGVVRPVLKWTTRLSPNH